jgi:hypothetical protein
VSGLVSRWWFWLLILVALAVSALVAVHIAGMRRLDDLQAELRGLGYATTMEELVALAPPVDRDRQDRFRRIMESRGPWMENVHHAMPSMTLSEQRHQPKDLERRDRALRDGATDMQAITSLFDEGPVELSMFGWCERDPAKLRTISLSTAAATPLPHLLAVRAFANWWSIRSCLDSDPEPHLRNLDRLAASMHRPGTLIDAMIAIAVSAIRDQTHLWLATRDRLGEERLSAWSTEMPHHLAWIASGFAGERCLFHEPFSRMTWDFSAVAGSPGGYIRDVWMFLLLRPTQGHECAYGISSLAGIEGRLLGRPVPAVREMPFGYRGIFIGLAMPNLFESVTTAAESANSHRLSRLAAVIAVFHRRTGTLPALTDLPRGLLAGQGPDLPALLYETFPPHRFRIGIDPTGPLPPSVPADRWTSKDYASAIGQPPSKLPQSPNRRWSMELDLEAILVPAPEPKPRPAKPPAPRPPPPASP